MNKKITSSIIAALIIAGSTSFTAFAAMDKGSVVIGNKAFSLEYANDPINIGKITDAIVEGGGVYVKDFSGKWINNFTGLIVDASVIPAVTYNNASGTTYFDAQDKDVAIVNNKIGYVHNPELIYDLKVRSTPNPNVNANNILGYLYNYQKIEILDTVLGTDGKMWDKIIYTNKDAYVSDEYILPYTSPSDDVVSIAKKITKQFEVDVPDQIAGNSDGQGLSLGYFQWCIGQGTLQPLLNRMDRQYNSEMKNIFGTNYNDMHNMILATLTNQIKWANDINDPTHKIIQPWYSQFKTLCTNQDFIKIEADAEVYTVNSAMSICNDYNLKTVRGFALAFDIATQNGSITEDAAKIIDTSLEKTPNMAEKNLLGVIANAVADSSTNNSEDVRSRKMAIVNGQGTVHNSIINLDADYGLSDNNWR